MDRTRKILLRIAGSLNLFMCIMFFSALMLIASNNQDFITQLMAIINQGNTTAGTNIDLGLVRTILIVLSVVYLVISVISFALGSIKLNKFNKYKYFLFINLGVCMFSGTIVSMVLLLVLLFFKWRDPIPESVTTVKPIINIEPAMGSSTDSSIDQMAIDIKTAKAQFESGAITKDQYDDYVSKIMERYANKEIDNANK